MAAVFQGGRGGSKRMRPITEAGTATRQASASSSAPSTATRTPSADQLTAWTQTPRCTAPGSRSARPRASRWLPPATRRVSRVEKLDPAWPRTVAASSPTGWPVETWSRAAIASRAPGSRASSASTAATERPPAVSSGRSASSSRSRATSASTVARSVPRPPRGSRSP